MSSSNFGHRHRTGQHDYQHQHQHQHSHQHQHHHHLQDSDYYLVSSSSQWPAPVCGGGSGISGSSSSSSSSSRRSSGGAGCEHQFLAEHQRGHQQLTDAAGLRRMRASSYRPVQPQQQPQGNQQQQLQASNHLHLVTGAKVAAEILPSACLATCSSQGGQRMALKLASGQRQAWQLGGRAASYAGCGSDGSLGGAHCHAQLTDECSESECSCSNSLECLAQRSQQQQQQPSPHQQHQHHHQPNQRHQQLLLSSGSLDRSRQPNQNQNQNPNQQQPVLVAQHFHPALMAHHSVPAAAPASQPAAQMSCPTSVAMGSGPDSSPLVAPSPPPPPPPVAPAPAQLVRQSTYTATSATISDSQPEPAPSDYVPAKQVVGHYAAAHKAPKQRGHQSVSFRRPLGPQVAAEQHQVVGYGSRSKSQRHSPAQQLAADHSRPSQPDPGPPLDQRRLRGSAGAKKRQADHYGVRPNLAQACAAPAGPGPAQQLVGAGPARAVALAGFAHEGYRLAAHQLGPLDAGLAGCSAPAISSHRTNSPWMRVSSIILTPIGIVIILFIVVSPLLHYLM